MTKPNQPSLPELVGEAGFQDEALLRDALSELVPPTQAPPQLLRERLLATVSRPRLRFAPLFDALSELFDLPDTDLAGIFERASRADAWVTSRVPGTQLLHLEGGPRVAGADNGLVRVEAGMRFPLHLHLGLERVLVLDGGYEDEQEQRVYLPGDWHVMQAGTSHAYRALPERELLYAVSLVGGVDVEGVGTLSPSSS